MALYRKYRPASFAEVVGQEHVTEPLSVALDSGRINHAYLFSGPRGCGKTSSARILARSLNCVQGPTSTPCGVCSSCVALAPGGPGNLDVIELDAASHGGVDDTRELRDRAFYAPAESRYRVFIVDEAHMVTTAGFNALLKIVEEPPAHLIFVFATTEPEKVLPTIRSRTHHYPFRLLPPVAMRGLMERICAEENVTVQDAVYPLVIRAGGGSPRDTLSVLDQLLAGAGDEGVQYSRALMLLGVTDVALIDEAVDALAAQDGAALFGTVEKVMDAGHDPRRFAVDLLDRFRDLILMRAVPDAGERGLVDAPADMIERMRDEAERIGPATLARYAETVHAGLGEMRGATAPRLLLEVMCARMLLPAASDAESAVLHRIERLERRLDVSLPAGEQAAVDAEHRQDRAAVEAPRADAPRAAAATEAAPRFVRPSERAAAAPPTPEPSRQEPSTSEPPRQDPPAPEPPRQNPPAAEAPRQNPPAPEPPRQEPPQQPHQEPPAREPAAQEPPRPEEPTREATPTPEPEPAAAPEYAHEPEPAAEPDPEPIAASGPDAADIRAVWSEVRTKVRERSRTVEVMLSGATVRAVTDGTLVLAHDSAPLAKRLVEPRNAAVIVDALRDVFGVEWTVQCEVGGAAAAPAPAAAPAAAPKERPAPPRFSRPSRSTPPPPPSSASPDARGGSDDIPPPPEEPDYPDPGYDSYDGPPPPESPEEQEEMMKQAKEPVDPATRRDPDEVALELLQTELGATPIKEV
ncbi:DNA polymerase III subunits gamma/tau [Rhodococcoides corynebacterioides]|uniref:DNA polymerase III subunits gamma/tau n=1 Tax=Rhodococcoides corynebacterioides TaxID=53972 RepID=UPI003F7D769D